MVMPRSRSRSFESMTRSATVSLSRNVPLWRSMASTSVVLPWSTWAMIAILRILGFSQKLLRVANWGLLLLYYGGRFGVLSEANVGTAALGCPSERNSPPSALFRHIFLVRPSQTPNRNTAIIPRQCSIENCARLQRRTDNPPPNHSRRLFDNMKTSSKSGDPTPRKVHAKPQKPELSPYSCG